MKLKKTLFKSIFAKYFTVVAALITISFMLSSCVQVVFIRRYWVADKRDFLQEQAQQVTAMLRENVLEYYPDNYYVSEEVRPLLARLAEAGNVNVLIVDKEFRIQMCSHTQCEHYGKYVPSPVREKLRHEDFLMVTNVGNLYPEEQYTTGVPLKMNDTIAGYVVVSSSATALTAYVIDYLQMYSLSALAALMIAFVALYIMTYQMTQPLRRMAELTRQFAEGDFSGRVKVRGNDEVAELGQALNGMAVALSSAEQTRRTFVANVSHDLKTPMTTIAGFVDGILDGTVPPDRRTEYLRVVSDETKRLSRLVTSMLDLTRIDSGQLTLNPAVFDLTTMVCTTMLSFERRVEDKRITVEGLDECEPLSVSADFDLLQQAVYNLLDNAVKFTNEGGTIRLTLAKADGHAVCIVRNTGEGIPTSELPHIFEQFYKSDRSRSIDKTGTGLGLYIVKTVVDLHGGEITVRAKEGEYCEFVMVLPDLQKK